MIVLDTSVLVDFLRGTAPAAAERLRQMEDQGTPFVLPAICCQEVLQGAKDSREWGLLLSYLDTQRILYPKASWSSCAEASRIFLARRRLGITIRSTQDCLIAQMVIEQNGILLHDDEDFKRIKGVRPLRTVRQ